MLQSIRPLAKQRAFSLTVIATLALGTGLVAAILSLIQEIYLKPLPYKDADRLAILFSTYPERGWLKASASLPEMRDLGQRARSLESLGAFAAFRNLTLTGAGPSEEVQTNFSDAAYLEIEGVKPALGRLFTEAESRRDSGASVIVVQHRFWQNRLGGRLDVIGSSVQLNGRPFTVVGVLPENYRDIGERWQRTEIFAPLSAGPLAYQASMFDTRAGREYYALIKLKPGITVASAQREFDGIAQDLAKLYPADQLGRGFQLMSVREFFYGEIQPLANALAAGAVFVMLMTCVNLAHLFFVQGESRSGELAVRAALGAERATLIRLCLQRVAALTVPGCGIGIGLGFALVELFNRRGVLQMPTFTTFAIDPTVVALTIVVVSLCAIAFGVIPALRTTGTGFRDALRSQTTRTTGDRGAAVRRNLMITVEVAIAVVLLVGAGVTALSLKRMQETPTGYEAARLLTASFELDRVRYPDRPALAAALRRLESDLQHLPGAEGTSLWGMRMLGHATYNIVTTPGNLDPTERRNQFMTRRLHVMPDTFSMLGIGMIAGRSFSPDLTPDREPWEVVVGENYARRFWPDRSPADVVGETVRFPLAGGPVPARIVGIASNVKHNGRAMDEGQLIGDIYFSQHQLPVASQSVLVRYRGDVAPVLAGVKNALASFDPQLALTDVSTMEERLQAEAGVQSLTASLFGIYATIAALLAALGVYGVLAFAVSQRTREFGVRLAIGARPGQIMSRLVRDGLQWTLLGVGLGLTLARGFAGALQALLVPGVTAVDPRVLVGVSVAMIFVAIVALSIPAIRAARTNPLVVLRSE